MGRVTISNSASSPSPKQHENEVVYVDRPVEVEVEKWSERVVEILVDREVEKLIASPRELVEVEKIVYVTDPEMAKTIEELEHRDIQKDIDHKKEMSQLYEELDTESKSLVRLRNQQQIDRKRKRRLMNRIHKDSILNQNLLTHTKVAYAVGVVLMLLGYFSH